jgi:acetolactate synthase-1/3 small subunit
MITATVNDTSGVMNRFTGVLSRRQVNIESISVGRTEQCNISRITIVINVADEKESEQVLKQLNKQIDILKVSDITEEPHLERELLLAKINAPIAQRAEIQTVIDPFRGSIIDVNSRNITIQVTGTSEKIDAFLEVMSPYGIKKISRTGIIGLLRG